jgi:prevent-host-death family protein
LARKWQLQEAKKRFSELVDSVLEQGPQTVTRHGKDVVVVVSKDDFVCRRKRGARGTILPFLRSLGFARVEIDFERSSDLDRDLEL